MIEATPQTLERPELPGPKRTRWQPLRLGLVELFRYDSEEFWFRDGHLLLRGNNGTGKSKVLALTLPFLFDARLASSRLEPDGDPGKKMTWNLLLGNYERRTGYAWIEFGRLRADGSPQFLTLGAGLAALAARQQVESWYFIADGPRIDLWLTTVQRGVVPKERLRDALAGVGQVFENAKDYRRAVDERLFQLGTTRYEALMDTLVQLRQPQLSKRPDETNLSNALTESLPPLGTDMLGDVAEALNRLEDDRRQLEGYQDPERAVTRFEQRNRLYAGIQSRLQARRLRQAQTEFDNASRTFHDAQSHLATTRVDELRALAASDAAALNLTNAQARLDTLRSDPTMQDANRLEQAQRDASARRTAMNVAHAALVEADARLARAMNEAQEYATRLTRAEHELDTVRRDAGARSGVVGIANRYAVNLLSGLNGAALADFAPHAFEDASADLITTVTERREQIALVRRRQAALAHAEVRHAQRRESLDAAHDDADRALERRDAADAAIERIGETLVTAWHDYFSELRELAVSPNEALAALAEWVLSPVSDNPARLALQAAQQETAVRFGARRAEITGLQRAVEAEDRALADEQRRLEAGEDTAPPVPYTRDVTARSGERAGAPLWQLLEFRAEVETPSRAGLEAALEATGLLDAWVTPDGGVVTSAGETLVADTRLLARPPQLSSLADWLQCAAAEDRLRADLAERGSVEPAIVERLLAGVACGDHDPGSTEAWIAPDGRFRLGALAGAWTKPSAVYIGFAARTAARARRLAEIAERRTELDAVRANLDAQLTGLVQAEIAARDEWRRAPSDDALMTAHATAWACARDFIVARDRRLHAQARFEESDLAVQAVRRDLVDIATDLQLPETVDSLLTVEIELDRFSRSALTLTQASSDVRSIWPERIGRLARKAEANADRAAREQQVEIARHEAQEAAARWEVLRDTVGASVSALQAQLAQASAAVAAGQRVVESTQSDVRSTGEARAVAYEQASHTERLLQVSTASRAAAVGGLQTFAATGLIAVALIESGATDLPDMRTAWTIDPALSLARHMEQMLTAVDDGDEAWRRIQQRIGEDFTELQRAVSALGQQVQGETNDYGFVVYIVYQNRPESPGQLARKLAAEIAQRRELLSATERDVLENHLQAEIATEVRRLLVAAEKQVEAINAELHKRPTSTGVRYRLQWLPLAEGADGAPVGLEAARKRLLNTSSDLWSAEDRRVVGALLQQRIAAERERADITGSSSLTDQLARALDYRRWHAFRVQRWQDEQWRKLSGPASSGERALGLTVPLFAAVASFYTQSGYSDAPRLVLLDEAFAGIDAAARAHCMALIREFDLDFVITSESEWACYAELPGVAICHLQRREGVDAVLVSRWTWDGRARRPEDDPNRASRRRRFDTVISSVADDRLQRLLGASELAMLRKRLRRRFERCATGEAPERFRISGLSAVEHAALAGLLGRSPRFSGSLEIDVASLNEILQRAGIAASLRAALEQLDGPMLSLADERTRSRAQWSQIVDACGHFGLRGLLQTPAGMGLLKRCSRGDVRTATELCLHAQAVLTRLPVRSVTRAQLAASVLGDAHALDSGRAEATIVLAALRHAIASAGNAFAGDPGTEPGDDLPDDDAARNVWARAGVLVNELARPVLFLNLPPDSSGSFSFVAGEPGYVSLRALVRSAPAWSAIDRDIFICENPNVVAIAADELGSHCSPLVCTEGMPAAAQRLLLTQLSAAGARLRYHGDFDWAGLRIGNYLMRELDILPWRFGAADYLDAIEAAVGRRHRLHGVDVQASWDEDLTLAMRDQQIAIAEEAVAGLLMSDLEIFQPV